MVKATEINYFGIKLQGGIITEENGNKQKAIETLMKVEIEQGNIDAALVLHLYREKVLSVKEKYQLACNYLAKEWSLLASKEIESEEGESGVFLSGRGKASKIIAEAKLKHTVDAVLQFAIGENQIRASIDIAGKLGASAKIIDSIIKILDGENFLKHKEWSGVELLENNHASDKAVEAIIKRAMVAGKPDEVLRVVSFRRTDKGHNLTPEELENFIAGLIMGGDTKNAIKMANYRQKPGLTTEEFKKLAKIKRSLENRVWKYPFYYVNLLY